MKAEGGDRLTTGEAARILGVTPDTVLKWIKKGRLPATRTPGGHYRVTPESLEPFLPSPSSPHREAFPEGWPPAPEGSSQEIPCWQYLAGDGEVREACHRCIVYRVKATRCFLMAGMDADVGHAREFCQGSCEDCVYYRRLRGLATQILFITADVELVERLDCFQEESFTLRLARNGYEASAILHEFRPEAMILDTEGLPDLGLSLLDSIAADPRVTGVRVILVLPPGVMGRMLQRPRHRLVAGMLEKPQVCGHIAQVVNESLKELPGPVQHRSA